MRKQVVNGAIFVTCHRAENVDNAERLEKLLRGRARAGDADCVRAQLAALVPELHCRNSAISLPRY
ncbi:MAG: hypothetical protein HY741_13365 [Chloroflexi bacterium]|nr:hypothetical protein [Chloroflexota bacterium]